MGSDVLFKKRIYFQLKRKMSMSEVSQPHSLVTVLGLPLLLHKSGSTMRPLLHWGTGKEAPPGMSGATSESQV